MKRGDWQVQKRGLKSWVVWERVLEVLSHDVC